MCVYQRLSLCLSACLYMIQQRPGGVRGGRGEGGGRGGGGGGCGGGGANIDFDFRLLQCKKRK